MTPPAEWTTRATRESALSTRFAAPAGLRLFGCDVRPPPCAAHGRSIRDGKPVTIIGAGARYRIVPADPACARQCAPAPTAAPVPRAAARRLLPRTGLPRRPG